MSKRMTNEVFIKRAKEVHGDKYDYSKIKYVNIHIKVCIICPIHGEFWQSPNKHINRKHGCPKCNGGVLISCDDFIEKAKEVHGDKYDYSKVEYVNTNTKVCIICPIHGEFWQSPNNHINLSQGCPRCNYSHLENDTFKLLSENNIIFEEQKHFEWLGKQSLDFYLPKYNIAIECQGIQHFFKFGFEKDNKKLNIRKNRDVIKSGLCKNNGIEIFYINYNDNIEDKINELITKINDRDRKYN